MKVDNVEWLLVEEHCAVPCSPRSRTPFSRSSQQPTVVQVKLISTCRQKYRAASTVVVIPGVFPLPPGPCHPRSMKRLGGEKRSAGDADSLHDGGWGLTYGLNAAANPWILETAAAPCHSFLPGCGDDRDGKRVMYNTVAGRTSRADVSKLPQRRDTPRRPCHREPFGLSKYSQWLSLYSACNRAARVCFFPFPLSAFRIFSSGPVIFGGSCWHHRARACSP